MNSLKFIISMGVISSFSFSCVDVPDCKADLTACKKVLKYKSESVWKCVSLAKDHKDILDCEKKQKDLFKQPSKEEKCSS